MLDPDRYINDRIKAILHNQHKAITKIIILTTYGDILLSSPEPQGYSFESINMPAGPDDTFMFSKSSVNPSTNKSYTLYLEVVNELDEKIRPTFIFRITNQFGQLCGGACGSISRVGNEHFAYLATLVVKKGMPRTMGSLLMEKVDAYMRSKDVMMVNLGTQTAVSFYKKQGFSVIKEIVPDLRIHITEEGSSITNDLVIMEKNY